MCRPPCGCCRAGCSLWRNAAATLQVRNLWLTRVLPDEEGGSCSPGYCRYGFTSDMHHCIGWRALVLCTMTSAEQTPNFTLEEATLADIQAAIKDGRLTARRLVEMYLARIEAYDKKGPALNAVILVNPKALET